MRRIIGVILTVIVFLFLFYVVFIYEGPDVDVETKQTTKTEKMEDDKSKTSEDEKTTTERNDFNKIVSAEGYNDKLSMKEIDSIRAANNLRFTIDNKIQNSPHQNDLGNPQNGNVPAGQIDTSEIVIVETNL